MFYFNNAGAGLISDRTLREIYEYYKKEQINGAYLTAHLENMKISDFYTSAGKLINAEASHIAFVDSASRGWNLAIHGLKLTNHDNIITLSSEFGTNLIVLFDYANKTGANLHVIDCEIDGSFDLSRMEDIIKTSSGRKVVAISHAAAQGSIVNPVEEIGALVKKYNAIYILDGCQSAGQIPVDVALIQCDVFVASGRKWLRGPRGTGFLYVKDYSIVDPTQLDLAIADLHFSIDGNIDGLVIREDGKRYEIWEKNMASVVGLSSSINEALEVGILNISKQVSKKADRIRNAVCENPKLKLVGKKNSPSGIIGFFASNPEDEKSVQRVFEKYEINTSSISDYDCPLFFPQTGITSIFRLSPHYYTEEAAVRRVCQALYDI